MFWPGSEYMIRRLLIVAAMATLAHTADATVTRYEEVKNWPTLPVGVALGETAEFTIF